MRSWSQSRSEYNYVLIDTPPSLGILTLNALVAADSVLVPMQCEYYALEGLSALLGTINKVKAALRPALELEGLVLTMFDSRNRLSHEISDEVRKHFPEKVFQQRDSAQRADVRKPQSWTVRVRIRAEVGRSRRLSRTRGGDYRAWGEQIVERRNLDVEPAVGSTPPWAGVTPAPSEGEKMQSVAYSLSEGGRRMKVRRVIRYSALCDSGILLTCHRVELGRCVCDTVNAYARTEG